MVRPLRFNSKNLADLEAQIPMLTSIPQKAFVILYNGSGLQNGYDHVILLAEKLLAASGKHVVLICSNRNWVNEYSLEYCSYAEPAFDTWKDRIFACVLDNSQNDFVYNRELYNAIKGRGYIDAIYHCLFEKDEEGAQQYLAEARKLSSFKDTVIKSDVNMERHQISMLEVRPEDKKLLERYNPRVSMWIDIIKETGEIFNWEYSISSILLGNEA